MRVNTKVISSEDRGATLNAETRDYRVVISAGSYFDPLIVIA